jgi:hypothetical protein
VGHWYEKKIPDNTETLIPNRTSFKLTRQGPRLDLQRGDACTLGVSRGLEIWMIRGRRDRGEGESAPEENKRNILCWINRVLKMNHISSQRIAFEV